MLENIGTFSISYSSLRAPIIPFSLPVIAKADRLIGKFSRSVFSIIHKQLSRTEAFTSLQSTGALADLSRER